MNIVATRAQTFPSTRLAAVHGAAQPAGTDSVVLSSAVEPATIDADARLSRSLRNMQAAGWHFGGRSNPTVAEAHDLIHKNSQVPLYESRRLDLTSPNGLIYSVRESEGVAALDYFHGGHDAKCLLHPDLAQKMECVEAAYSGVSFAASCQTVQPSGLWSGYVSMALGRGGRLTVGSFPLADVTATTAAELEQQIKPLQPILDMYKSVLLPAADRQELHATHLGKAVETLRYLGSGEPAERADLLLRVATAVRNGPEQSKPLHEQTTLALDAYRDLHSLGLSGGAVGEAATTLVGFIQVAGATHVKEAMRYLYREIPQCSTFADQQKERATVLRRVMQAGVPAQDAPTATEWIVARSVEETLDSRLQVFEKLVEAGGGQTALRNFQCVLMHREPTRTLPDAARPYAALLRILRTREQQQDAPSVMGTLHAGLRSGQLCGSVDDLVDRFSQLFVLSRSSEEACRRLAEAPPPNAEAATVEKQSDTLRIGGIRIPVRNSASAVSPP